MSNRLTPEQRDRLLVAIAEKLGVQVETEPVKKPRAFGVSFEDGVKIIHEMPNPYDIQRLASYLQVTDKELHTIRFSQGANCQPKAPISKDTAFTVWSTYCAKRGW